VQNHNIRTVGKFLENKVEFRHLEKKIASTSNLKAKHMSGMAATF